MLIARVDHVFEFLLISTPGNQFIAHGLVSLPPWPIRRMDDSIFTGRGNLKIHYRNKHGGKSKGTTCVVDRDVTAYMVVDRVLRFPTE